MKKSLRLSLLTMAAMLVSGSASADNLPTRSLIYDVPDGEANLFGYLAYDTKYRTFGFVNLQSQNPGAYSLTKDYGNVVGQTPSLQAGTFVGDEYIVYEATIYQNAIMPRAFSAINPLTGELTTKREIPSTDEYLILNEMTYDPKTKRLFGMHYNANDQRETAVPTYWKTDIYEISTVTYALTKVATIDMPLYTMSADNVAPQTAEVTVAAETAERWLTLDVEDEETYGWNMPFYVGSPYSQVQALFLESDMSMKDIDLTAIRFFYDGHMDGKFVFPARISMKRSDRTKLCQEDNQYRGDFDTEDFTQVFDGQVAIVGNQENTLLEIPFDQPYRYTGGNLLMKFESLCGSNTLPDALNTHPVWSYSIATEQPRAARMDGADEWSEDVWAEASLPYVAVAYKSATGVGTIQLGHAGQMAVALEGGRLLLPATCDHVALYSQTGALVAKGQNTRQLGVAGLPAGLYLLRATVQGQVLTQKVVIR